MKKKLYDFTVANAIIVLLAYAFLLIISIYSIFDNGKISWVSLVFSVLLIISLIMIIWYFVYLAVTITDEGIRHGNKFIYKQDVKYKIEYNQRFRYDELIFYDKYVNYNKLTKKEMNRKRIIVQYFPKYEVFLKEYFSDRKKGSVKIDEEKSSK